MAYLNWRRFFIFACAVSTAGLAFGQVSPELSLYGVKLRNNFELKECAISKFAAQSPAGKIISPGEKYNNPSAGHPPCFRHRLYENKANPELESNAVVSIAWPLGEGPKIASHPAASVLVLDGVVHRVWIFTHGFDLQDRDVELLSEKFGTPTSRSVVGFQNRFGAKFQGISAKWDFGGATLAFDGMYDGLNSGIVVLETSEGAAAYKARLNRSAQSGPKM